MPPRAVITPPRSQGLLKLSDGLILSFLVENVFVFRVTRNTPLVLLCVSPMPARISHWSEKRQECDAEKESVHPGKVHEVIQPVKIHRVSDGRTRSSREGQ